MVNAERIRRDMIAIGASSGGVEALRRLFAALPDNLPAALMAVLHRSPYFESDLPRALGIDGTSHRIHEPEHGEKIQQSVIYVAPRDRHMIVEDGVFLLARTAKQHFTRPAIDPLFGSVAAAYGPRVVGVVLTGNGEDGTDGVIAIKRAGGISVAQDPNDATYRSMPRSAVLYDSVDLIVKLDELAACLTALANGEPIPRKR